MLSTICSAKQKSLQMCTELRYCQRWVTNREWQRDPQWRTRDGKTSRLQFVDGCIISTHILTCYRSQNAQKNSAVDLCLMFCNLVSVASLIWHKCCICRDVTCQVEYWHFIRQNVLIFRSRVYRCSLHITQNSNLQKKSSWSVLNVFAIRSISNLTTSVFHTDSHSAWRPVQFSANKSFHSHTFWRHNNKNN